MKQLLAWVFLGWLAVVPLAHAQENNTQTPLPRVILGIYDSAEETTPRQTDIHRLLEMPANYLGYDVQYHAVQSPLPKLNGNVAAVMIWLNASVNVKNPAQFLQWLKTEVIDAKRKLVIVGNLGIGQEFRKTKEGMALLNSVMAPLGLVDENAWVDLVYNARVATKNLNMVEFERPFGIQLQPYHYMRRNNTEAVTHLSIANPKEHKNPADMIVTSPFGGYVADQYAIYRGQDASGGLRVQQWLINPFEFLRLALGSDALPKPDVTTMNGRRIFYSQMDGDGWNNLTRVKPYKDQPAISAEVIRKEVFLPHQDLPFTVAPIAADLDTKCYGVKESAEVARQIFGLPNIQAASHTYSHILLWDYFSAGDPAREKDLLAYYPPRPLSNLSFLDFLKNLFGGNKAWDSAKVAAKDTQRQTPAEAKELESKILSKYFNRIPRSYACAPFDLTQEINGSRDALQKLLPVGKRVGMINWSGDTLPFEGAITTARKAGLYNLNGGDVRYDAEYPSISYVAPIGAQVGRERQIYSGNGNENTYKRPGEDRYAGYLYLQKMVKLTNSPWRITPFNLYFHAHAGEDIMGLNALKQNLAFVKAQKNLIPMTAEEYTRVANGFYSTQIVSLGQHKWQIRNPGALRTIRFDKSSGKAVDFANSKGVLGQKYLMGSLYISLLPDISEAVIALKDIHTVGAYPVEETAYLIDSSWIIKNLQNSKKTLNIATQGYGSGNMLWHVPMFGRHTIEVRKQGKVIQRNTVDVAEDRLLNINTAVTAPTPVEVFIQYP